MIHFRENKSFRLFMMMKHSPENGLCRRILFVMLAMLAEVPLNAQIDSTNLPVFIIDTKGLAIPDEPKIEADLKIIYAHGQYNHTNDPANVYDGKVGIEIRGRYSASLPQKPYGLETRDAAGENLNVPLFDMPPENDWILLANYNDKSFMRNSLTFRLFRQMGHYAPRTQFCEVIVNGIYQGIYVFTEKIKRDDGRVDIATLNPEENSGDDLTGGYIIKIDYYNDFDSWTSNYNFSGQSDQQVHFVYEYPKPDDISGPQKQYIQQFIDNFETLLYSASYSMSKIAQYIDVDSFVDYFILNELARNVDAYKKSSFFYKEKDSDGGLLHMGPVWDFDWAWKNIAECYFGATDGSGWAYEVHQCDPWPLPPTWMNRLLNDQEFAQKVSERYFTLRNSVLDEAAIFHYIDSVALLLNDAQKRHFTRWHILGANVGAPESDEQPSSYAGEVTKLKNWISTRLSWLDTQIPGLIITNVPNRGKYRNPLIYPNPAGDFITVSNESDITVVQIYSTSGVLLLEKNLQTHSDNRIDVSTLGSGLFLVKVYFENEPTQRVKLIRVE
jgi:hypothetical protein